MLKVKEDSDENCFLLPTRFLDPFHKKSTLIYKKKKTLRLKNKWDLNFLPICITIRCSIYIPSFMIIGSVVSEELRWQDFGTDGRTDGRSDCSHRPAFAFGDAGKNKTIKLVSIGVKKVECVQIWSSANLLQFKKKINKKYQFLFFFLGYKRSCKIKIFHNWWIRQTTNKTFKLILVYLGI